MPETPNLPENLPKNLPVHLGRLLDFIAKNPSATYDEMAGFLGKTRETIRVYVRQLKEEYGLLKREGTPRSGSWKIIGG